MIPDPSIGCPQPLPHASGAPQAGQPFNFNALLDGMMIPRVIYRDRELSPGARLLWGVIRRFAWKNNQCIASDERLGEELGVHFRQIRRYSAQLVKAGLIRATERPGKGTCRELLWNERFESEEWAKRSDALHRAKLRRIEPDGEDTSDPGQKRPGGSVTSDRGGRSDLTRVSLEASLEASYRKPLPLTPSPETASFPQPENGGSGKGESEGSSARLDGQRPGALRGKERPLIKPRQRPLPEGVRPTDPAAREQRKNEMRHSLYYQWVMATHRDPPEQLIESVLKILIARRINETAFVLVATASMRADSSEPAETVWLKTAVEWEGSDAPEASAPPKL